MASTNESSRNEIELKIPLPVTVAAGALVLWAVGHAVRTRTVDDFVRYPLYFTVPAAVVLYAALIHEWWKSKSRKVSQEEVWMAVSVPIVFYLVAAAYYAVGASIKDAYFWLQSLDLSREQKIALAVGVTLMGGLVLFIFRRNLRSTYGLTEAVVGLVVAGNRVADYLDKPASDTALYLTVLTAGVYLVVRGLDNIEQGLEKDPIARKLLAFMRGRNASSTASAPATLAATAAKSAVASLPVPESAEPAATVPAAAPAQQTPA